MTLSEARQMVIDRAKPHGMEVECLVAFDEYVKDGTCCR
jgi:hypothetical protein